MKIVIAGGTGFIGTALVYHFSDNHSIILLGRRQPALKFPENVTFAQWDGKTVSNWKSNFDDCDIVINLAGEPLGHKRWTESQKKSIVESRINATSAIVAAIKESSPGPRLLLNASAIGYYGDTGDSAVDESSPKGKGFLADTCDKWEKTAMQAASSKNRVVLMRMGIVLEKSGGALAKMLVPFKLFAGGPPGSGKQWVSWIHMHDLVAAVEFIINNESISGPVNITSPEPNSMRQFCVYLAEALNRPSWVPVPELVLRSMLGEMSEMLLTSQRVLPKKLLQAGFTFRYPKADEALKAIFGKK